MLFFDFTPDPVGSANNNNRIFLTYNGSFNRLIFRLRTNSTNFDCNYALNSGGSNGTITGVTNTTSGWRAAQRGTTNAAGFTHLAGTYDASETVASNALKLYWNGSSLATVTVNSNTRTNGVYDNLTVCTGASNVTGAANINADIDEFTWFDKSLSSTEVGALYASGVIKAAKESGNTGVINAIEEAASFDQNNSATVKNAKWSASIIGGTTPAY